MSNVRVPLDVNICKNYVACVTLIQNEIRSECLVMRIEGASAGASNETDHWSLLDIAVRHHRNVATRFW